MGKCDATPWFVMPPTEADSTKGECLVRNNMRIIAKVSVPSDTGPYQGRSYSERLETALTNARLIAAAPELLKELQNIANADTSDWDDPNDFKAWAQNRARVTLAKVRGD